MKKILIILIALIVAVAVVGPKIVGAQFNNRIHNIVDTLNANPGYEASVTEIQNNWFSTTAQVKVGLLIPDIDAPGMDSELANDFTIDVNVIGYHGPILTDNGFNIGWLNFNVNTISNETTNSYTAIKDEPLYKLNGSMSLLGQISFIDNVAAIDYTDPKTQAKLSFTGTKGKGTISKNGFAYESSAENFTFLLDETLSLVLSGFSIEASSPNSFADMLNQSLYDSYSRFSITSISIEDFVDQSSVQIDNSVIEGVTTFDQAQGLGDIEFKTNVASFDANELQLSDLLTVIELNNIQAEFILAYQKMSGELIEYANNLEKTQQLLKAFMDEHLLSQLQANPEYNISKISGKIDGSAFSGKVMTKLNNVTALPDTLEDKSFWVQHSIVDSIMTIEKAAAEYIAGQIITSQLSVNPQFAEMSEAQKEAIIAQQIPATLDMLVQQNMLTIEDENYQFTFTMQNGASLLNGNPIPLPL